MCSIHREISIIILTSCHRQCILLVNHIYITSHDKCQLTVGTWCAILDLFTKNTMIQTKKGIATIDETTGKITSIKKGKTQISVIDTISGQTTVADVYVLGEDDITFPQIESNNYSTVTLKANGEVWSYGYNGYGQLGTGDTQNKILPTYTNINNIMQIALGKNHTVAVDKDGHVFTWGYNSYGQLGNGTTGGTVLEKVQVKSTDGEGVLENIVSVAAGDSFTMALDKDGNVYTWGYNSYGQLGNGDTNYRVLPVKVDGLQGIVKIKAGNGSAFAIDNNNCLWVAGYNGYGNLGDGKIDAEREKMRKEETK